MPKTKRVRFWVWASIILLVLFFVWAHFDKIQQAQWTELGNRLKGATKMDIVPPPYGARGKIAIFKQEGDTVERDPSFEDLEFKLNDGGIGPDNIATGILLKISNGSARQCVQLSSNGDNKTIVVYDEKYAATVVDVRSLTIIGVQKYDDPVDFHCGTHVEAFLARIIDPSKVASVRR